MSKETTTTERQEKEIEAIKNNLTKKILQKQMNQDRMIYETQRIFCDLTDFFNFIPPGDYEVNLRPTHSFSIRIKISEEEKNEHKKPFIQIDYEVTFNTSNDQIKVKNEYMKKAWNNRILILRELEKQYE